MRGKEQDPNFRFYLYNRGDLNENNNNNNNKQTNKNNPNWQTE